MSHIAVDTNLPDCPEVLELEEILDAEEVWRHLFYLWSWAFESDFQTGVVKLTPALLSRVSRWNGDKKLFFDALCQPLGPNKLPWLVNKGKGYFYLRGWSRNERFFKKKEQGRGRQRRYREKLDAQRDAESDASLTVNVCPDRSPSRSRSPSPPHSTRRKDSSNKKPFDLSPEDPKTKSAAKKKDLFAAQLAAIRDHYLKIYPGRKIQANSEPVRKKIVARLKEGYTVEQICRAIDGNGSDEYCRENGHTGLELICRDAGHVDKYMAKATTKQASKPIELSPWRIEVNQICTEYGIGNLLESEALAVDGHDPEAIRVALNDLTENGRYPCPFAELRDRLND